MSSIKEKLDSLTKEQNGLLMYAFEHELAQYVICKDGTYIGVNLQFNRNLEPEMTAGVWSAGKCNSPSLPRTL